MPDPAPLLFALAAGTMSASYAILLRLSAGSINPAIGAIVFAILRVSQRRVRPSLDCWPTHARPTRPTPQSSTRVCRAPSPASRPSTLGAVGLARFLVRHRANRGGMAHQGFDLQLTRYDDRGWRATFYTAGMEHSPTSATGTRWEPTPWHATQRAA
jgi:hypothetical protein